MLMDKKNLRVLHLPTTIGGNPQGLSRHLNELGLHSVSMVVIQNYFNYSVNLELCNKQDNIFLCQLKRLKFLYQELFCYDLIHFNFGTTLFEPIPSHFPSESWLKNILIYIYSKYTSIAQLVELSLLKFRKKPIFIHYQGDDARQGGYCLKHFKYNITSQVDESYYNAYSDKFKRKQIVRMDFFCDQIYAVNPDLLHVLPDRAKFIPYGHISLEEWLPVYNQADNRCKLRIGHAPSHRKVKGTKLILDALKSLKEEGYLFELVLIEGLRNEEARKAYEAIDVLVDQLFAGWYGGLAVEVMALGKPVLVYIREGDLKFVPAEMRKSLPFIQVTPDTITNDLRKVLEMPKEELMSLAKSSRAFVERWHDPLEIAKEIKADYEFFLKKYGRL